MRSARSATSSTSRSTKCCGTRGLHYLVAATCSFLVAVTSNYTWNRLWTFREHRGHVGIQGMRFLLVSVAALGANLLVLYVLVAYGGLDKLSAQAIAIVGVTPLNFIGNKLWSFRRADVARVAFVPVRGLLAAALAALAAAVLVPSAFASTGATTDRADLRRERAPDPDSARSHSAPAPRPAPPSPRGRRCGSSRAIRRSRPGSRATRTPGAATMSRTTRRPATGRSRSGGAPQARSRKGRSTTRRGR